MSLSNASLRTPEIGFPNKKIRNIYKYHQNHTFYARFKRGIATATFPHQGTEEMRWIFILQEANNEIPSGRCNDAAEGYLPLLKWQGAHIYIQQSNVVDAQHSTTEILPNWDVTPTFGDRWSWKALNIDLLQVISHSASSDCFVSLFFVYCTQLLPVLGWWPGSSARATAWDGLQIWSTSPHRPQSLQWQAFIEATEPNHF